MFPELTKDEIAKALETAKVSEALKDGTPVTSVKPDADLIGATVGQACLMLRGIPDLKPEMTDEFVFRANAVALKLCSLRYHSTRYESIQKRRSEEVSSNRDLLFAIKKGVKITELELLFEIEAFFFQYKSTLDMLVKILCPVTGLTAGSLSSYRDKGSGIIKKLEKFKKNKNHGRSEGRIDWLIEEIEKAKTPWLESVIRLRDTFSHYRPEIAFGFEWDDKTARLVGPTAETPEGAQTMNLIMRNLIESIIAYCTNFTAISISCMFPTSASIQVMSDNEKQYIGALWNMNLSRAVWKLGSNVIREYTPEEIEAARKST